MIDTKKITFSKKMLNTLKTIGRVADNLNYPCYVVGGFVRDYFMGQQNKDIDIVVVGSGKIIAEESAKALAAVKVTIYESYGTAQIMTQNGLEIEFVGARKEFYHRKSRNPIVENGTIMDDMSRRDFNLNAMALCLNQKKNCLGQTFLNPFNCEEGLKDIQNKVIRSVGIATERFDEDALRMLRCIRFATRFDFNIEKKTFDAIKTMATRLSIITRERILDELNKMMMCKTPSKAIRLLHETGLLKMILPEIDVMSISNQTSGTVRHKDIFTHTLQVLDNVANVSDNLYLRYAALFHDVGKPKVKKLINGKWTFFDHAEIGAKMITKIFTRMGFPLDNRMLYVQKIVKLHMRPMALCEEGVTDAAIRRILFDAGNYIDDLLILCNADITSRHQDKIERFQKNYEYLKKRMVELEESDRLRNFQPPVDGTEIMEMFNLTPCKMVGVLKESVKDAILDGVIPNEHDAAKAFVIQKFNELNKK